MKINATIILYVHLVINISMCFRAFFIVALLSIQSLFAQLSNFTFQVNASNETCLGNGSLNFLVTNTTPGAALTYSVYLLPNVTTPIAVTSNTALTGLNSGVYQVVATQTLGANSGTQQQNATIINTIQNLSYTISGVKPICGNEGVLTVNVNSGNPVTYQIINGPITTGIQNTNVFNNLPVGQYQIRVVDVCGNAVIQTYTLLQSLPGLNIDFGTVVPPLIDCNTLKVSNYFAALSGFTIAYPINFQYTVFPPGGGTPVVLNQSVNSGNVVLQNIPFHNGQQYYYNLVATDACGNVYTLNNNPVNRKFDIALSVNNLNCSTKQIEITPSYFIAPYTINFTSFPSGFNPIAYNGLHPGPFLGNSTAYGGVGNSIPLGSYTITVTDACGRTASKSINVQNIPAMSTYIASSDGCGKVMVTLSTVLMQSVSIISAPNGFPNSLPYDVTSFIDPVSNNLIMTGLMEGNYIFHIVDICGIEYTLNVIVPPYIPNSFSIIQRPGCDLGFGSARMISDVNVVSAVLINAPSSYTGTLPLNLSIIAANSFYLSNVPDGNYVIQSINSCGVSRTDTIAISGYTQTTSNVVIQRNCGSFNLQFTHASNASGTILYWLQKLDVSTGNWVHPSSGIIYVNGSDPNTGNSLLLNASVNNLNLAFSGQFRILKSFQTFSANGGSIDCVKEIYSFEVDPNPIIDSVNQFGCSNGNSEAVVNVIGTPPFQYRITTKDGNPFLINNGNSNYFINLAPGIYNFQAEDSCGNLVNRIIEITNLAPLHITSSILCKAKNGSLAVPNISFLTYEWWKDNATTTILSTTNALNFIPFNNPNDFGVYHVRIVNTLNSSSCLNTELTFVISDALNNPHAGNDNTITYCGNQGTVNLQNLLSGTFDNNGFWTELSNSNGSLIGSNWDTTNVSFGTYQFLYQVNGFCSNSDEAIITINFNQNPEVLNLITNYSVCKNETVQIVGDQNNISYTYTWTGPNGFISNNPNIEILNAQPEQSGNYTLIISNGICNSVPYVVNVLIANSPEFYIQDLCSDNVKTLQVVPINNSFNIEDVSYTWSGPNGYISNSNPIQINEEAIGDYSVTVDNGTCVLNETITVLNLLCAIPKGISPNDDGLNDYFDLSGFDVKELKIFNRYGLEVYSQSAYKKEWYGQDFKGNVLPAATYYYVILQTTGESKTGWVYLQR